jgi:hypothetical protein
VAFPFRIRHVSCSSYSHGNSDFSFSQTGHDSASFLSFSVGFFTLGFIFHHLVIFLNSTPSWIKTDRHCFKIFLLFNVRERFMNEADAVQG